MKYEWKKHEKALYSAKEKPSSIVVPRQNYIIISGKGNPNEADFSEKASVLYSIAYAIKIRHKAFCTDLEQRKQFDYSDYMVFPLKGVWTSSDPINPLDKDSFIYTIMIKHPDFITKDMFVAAYEAVGRKKPHSLLQEVAFEMLEDSYAFKYCISAHSMMSRNPLQKWTHFQGRINWSVSIITTEKFISPMPGKLRPKRDKRFCGIGLRRVRV
ncbi:hypothetical protein SAMN04488542_107117 [Fontibacillus panacisegetis]|uniref:GyrI-like small molecule binding domain-containing protein n=1 Tax=Fontibacillus panacisegetis TaxID=670482 RepID=A0A1G7JDR6_9BACL|nr:hypothetical protein [Fontibacillus panacisegetis]SDF22914.1 hypothetical protein SAMN04488542_107117 [Fontibacillus panacisegetis]